MVFTFTGVPATEACLNALALTLESSYAYSARPIKFAQGNGTLSIRLPLPGTTLPPIAPVANVPQSTPMVSPTKVSPSAPAPQPAPMVVAPKQSPPLSAPQTSPTSVAPQALPTAVALQAAPSAFASPTSLVGGQVSVPTLGPSPVALAPSETGQTPDRSRCRLGCKLKRFFKRNKA
jgi:hypothetical protein